MIEPGELTLSLESFETLLRRNSEELSSYLEDVEIAFNIDNTKASTNCHFIKLNGNGQVRFRDFALFLANKVMDFAIPRSEISAAQKYYQEYNSTSKFAQLQKKAASLFTKLKKSGEGGEVLLYILIEEILKIPQILCKMNLKTSGQMHVHGCDGIHAKYDETSDLLSLYWGESKLYQTLDSGLTECLDSVKDFLLHADGNSSSQEREIQLVRSYIDLNDSDLEKAILNYLDMDSDKYNKVVYKGACLVGFDYPKYPNIPNSGLTNAEIKDFIKAEINAWKDKVKDKIGNFPNLKTFELHVFLIPFPSVQDFRDAFLKELGITRNEVPSK